MYGWLPLLSVSGKGAILTVHTPYHVLRDTILMLVSDVQAHALNTQLEDCDTSLHAAAQRLLNIHMSGSSAGSSAGAGAGAGAGAAAREAAAEEFLLLAASCGERLEALEAQVRERERERIHTRHTRFCTAPRLCVCHCHVVGVVEVEVLWMRWLSPLHWVHLPLWW